MKNKLARMQNVYSTDLCRIFLETCMNPEGDTRRWESLQSLFRWPDRRPYRCCTAPCFSTDFSVSTVTSLQTDCKTKSSPEFHQGETFLTLLTVARTETCSSLQRPEFCRKASLLLGLQLENREPALALMPLPRGNFLHTVSSDSLHLHFSA